MGGILAFFKKQDPRTPIQGIVPRLKNIALVHYKGLLGCILTVALTVWQPQKGVHYLTTLCMWIWMAIFFLIQPVNVPVTGMIPIFLLPMTGAVSTVNVCQCYFNENIALFVLGGMVVLLFNNSGLDRRVILWLLCGGPPARHSDKWMILKASTAAFFLSMFSSRLIVSSTIIELLTPAYTSLQTSTARYRAKEPDYDVMKNIVINSVQTASSIGCTAIIQSSYTALTMRAIWSTHPGKNNEFPDLFNFLQYTCFAFPVVFVIFILNFVYHMLLAKFLVGKPMSDASQIVMRNSLLKHKDALPAKISAHIKLSLFFFILYLVLAFTRWSPWLNSGWSSHFKLVPQVPGIKDATLASLFVLALHILPCTCDLMKFKNAKTRSDLGVLKPESGIMWWRFMDKNTNYGYIILIGSGIAINTAVVLTKYNAILPTTPVAQFLTGQGFTISLPLVVLMSVIIGNAMTGVAACCTFLPFVLNMAQAAKAAADVPPPALRAGSVDEWVKKAYLGALGVGIGTSFGFMAPFLFTPAYFSHYTGKVPKLKMFTYSIGSAIICVIILSAGLVVLAPLIWDPNNEGFIFYEVQAPVVTTKAPAPE